MWVEALDLVLSRLHDEGLDFATVKAVSGAGMQHGTVFWNYDAEERLGGLSAEKGGLLEQLNDVFSNRFSPNWQDASTQKQCEEFERHVGGEDMLADITGSRAHHVSTRFLSSPVSPFSHSGTFHLT